jgi:shikimate dehydrogenase
MEGQGGALPGYCDLLGLFGHPVGHSLSPSMHNAALRAQGLRLSYVAFDVAPDRLGAAVEGVRALRMRGVNVTVPHKITVMTYLDDLEPTAARVGAVNTVVNEDGRLVGHNTDVQGFADALRSLLPQGAEGLTCVVLGAGGAARAIVAALVAERVSLISVHNRTAVNAEALCAAAASWGGVACAPLAEGALLDAVRGADLVVNATSVGMPGSVKESPLPVDILHSRHVVIDAVYGARPTTLVREARARGARAVDGKEMLVRQAAGSYELWTGMQPPMDAMRRSIEQRER